MVNKSLCTPCQSILAREDVREDVDYKHHSDGESFQHALQSHCRICLQAWTALESPDKLHQTSWSVFSYSNGVREIDFSHGSLTPSVQFTFEPWSGKASGR
jgi:hypothetical protein